MSLLSPGVQVQEIDLSQIAPTVSNSIAVFSGDFIRGPVGQYLSVSSESDLVSLYGEPNKLNFNDWYQAKTFLDYGDKLFISRASNTNGSYEKISGLTVSADVASSTLVDVSDASLVKVSDYICFGDATGVILTPYVVQSTDTVANTITLDRDVDITISADPNVYSFSSAVNAVYDAVQDAGTEVPVIDYVRTQMPILNFHDFEDKELSIPMNSTESKLKFLSRNPGSWGNGIEIIVAKSSDFGKEKLAFDGIYLDDLFEYAPVGSEFGVVIRYNKEIQEIYTVSFDENAKDSQNRSMYVETVINSGSSFIFVKDNPQNTNDIKTYLYPDSITLVNGTDSPVGLDDLVDAYSIFDNKEATDVDIVIANELDGGVSAKNLAETRKDCMCYIGANYSDVVGKKSSVAVSNLIAWRKTGSLNFDSMFCVSCPNYFYVYNKYADRYVWVNVAGSTAGLRARTSTTRDAWWSEAGLNRGIYKNVKKLAFNPSQAQRDLMYKNGLNPIVNFAGQGNVLWGNKTLLSKSSSFNRINVRSLFNVLERSLSKMAKYQVMEFNDSFTRNRISSIIKPFLSTVQAGRGIQDYLVINNTVTF